MEVEILSRLIADIYDASLDRELWTGVLKSTCEVLGGCSAALYSLEAGAQYGRFYYSWGDDPEYTALFFQTYTKINPLNPHLMMTKAEECYIASRLMPYEEFTRSRFFKEWCTPQGFIDLLGATLDKTSTSIAAISTGHVVGQGLMDDKALAKMQLLAPHFRRAVLISRVIELHKLNAEMMATTLDGLAAALFLVDGNATIVYANRRGQAMLEEGDATVPAGGTLALFDPQANRSLRDVIADAVAGDAAVAARGIAIPTNTRSGERFVTHLMPLTSGARLAAGLSHAAVAAVFIRKAALDLPLPIEAAARQFHLTPSEIRVLYAVMETGGVTAMAAMLGVSEWTVKTHLAHLFEKTGAANQTDLVKLVAGLSSPFVQ